MHLCLSATVRSVKINDWVETVMDRCVHNCVHIEYGHGRSRECTEFRCSPQVLYNTVYTLQQYNSTVVQQPAMLFIRSISVEQDSISPVIWFVNPFYVQAVHVLKISTYHGICSYYSKHLTCALLVIIWFEIQPSHLLALVLDTISVDIDIRCTT